MSKNAAELLKKLQELQARGIDLDKTVLVVGTGCCGGDWDGAIEVGSADELGSRCIEIYGDC